MADISTREVFFVNICTNWGTLTPYDVVDFVTDTYSTTSSRSCALRALRAFATKYYPEIPADWINLLRLPKKDYYKSNKAYQRKLFQAVDNPINCNAQVYLQTMCDFLAADSLEKIGAGILMATGRRTVEVAQCGKFSLTRIVHDTKPAFWLKFGGAAKKRDPTSPPFDIPVLIQADQLLAVIERFRAATTALGVKTSLWQTRVMREIKAVFPEFTMKTCRAVYVPLSWELFRPFVVPRAWTMQVLGHTNLRVGFAYETVHLLNIRKPVDPHDWVLPC